MIRCRCSGPLVQVKGVGFSLYFFRYRCRKSFRSFFGRCTLCVSACRVRILKKHSIMFIQEACVALRILDRFHIVAKMNEALDDVPAAAYPPMALAGYDQVFTKPAAACQTLNTLL